MRVEQINKLYDILVITCGASERLRDSFVHEYSKSPYSDEWRFCGELGYGGKFRVNHNGVYVDYYNEDKTKQRDKIVSVANEQIDRLGLVT